MLLLMLFSATTTKTTITTAALPPLPLQQLQPLQRNLHRTEAQEFCKFGERVWLHIHISATVTDIAAGFMHKYDRQTSISWYMGVVRVLGHLEFWSI
jgi:hypothetical protein